MQHQRNATGGYRYLRLISVRSPRQTNPRTDSAARVSPGGYPMKVWIGQDGLVYQMQFSISEDPTAASSAPGELAPPQPGRRRSP